MGQLRENAEETWKIWEHMETCGNMVGNGGKMLGKWWVASREKKGALYNNFFHGERRISWFKHRFIAMSLLHHQNGAIYQQLFNGLVEGKKSKPESSQIFP